jgi:hypothetical protein
MSASDKSATVDSGGSVLAQISNEMVRLYKEQFGRGPTHARALWCGLVLMGEHQRLRDMRMFFQYASVREFCAPVERLTGRTVRAFLSGIDTAADGLSVETFVFYAEGEEGPSRADLATVA